VSVAIVLGTAFAGAQQGTRGGEWTRYGGDAGQTKYAPLDQINKSNVSQLRIAWRRPGIDASITANAKDLTYSNNFRVTPLMIQGVLYSPNAIGLVEAFHPGTGRTIWVQEPFADEPGGGLRGDSSHTGPTVRTRACS
jgi:quinoprotein glucose dehydrogenase